MKIDGNRPADTNAAEGTRRTETGSSTGRTGAAGTTGQGDRVELSGDAALLSAALAAATNAPEVREDVVERMKQKLAAGQIGQDSGTLADALLDAIDETGK